jgi:hypothetical protein
VLVGLHAHLIRRLQFALNASAQLIHHLRRSKNITGALVSLHRLHVQERIQYMIAVPAYKVLHGTAPRYLGLLVRVSDLPDRRALRSASTLVVWSFHRLHNLRLAVEPSRSLPLEHRRIYRRT